VHLLAGAGAILGWQDAIIAFFLAPFMGLLAAVVGYGVSRLAKGQVRLIPFGPYLAGATVVMLLFREPIRALLLP
jgi:leader peptidase (prepilin peptidase)/N-methyltransferase